MQIELVDEPRAWGEGRHSLVRSAPSAGPNFRGVGIAVEGSGRLAAFGNLGAAYADLGETPRAIEMFEQRLEIARQIGDRRGEAIASWNLGLAYEKLNELARSAELMQVLVDFEWEIGHPDAEKDAAEVAALRARLAGE